MTRTLIASAFQVMANVRPKKAASCRIVRRFSSAVGFTPWSMDITLSLVRPSESVNIVHGTNIVNSPSGNLSLGPALASQPPGLNVLHHERRRTKLLAQGFMQVFEDVQARVESHKIDHLKWSHGVIESEL